MGFSDLIIKDDEFEAASKEFSAFHRNLSEAIQQYKTIVTSISECAVTSGATHDAIVLFLDHITSLERIVGDLSNRMEMIVSNFIYAIESADNYLYDAGISNTPRNFSQYCYDTLINCLDDPWCSVTDKFGDWVFGKYVDVLSILLDADRVKARLNSCHELLLDFNDETISGLYSLFEAVHAVDEKYGLSLYNSKAGDHNTFGFVGVELTLNKIKDMLDHMADIIKPGNGTFTVDYIQEKLGNTYQELLKYYNQTVEASMIYKAPTVKEISDFASHPWAATYFSGFNTIISDFVCNFGGLEIVQMVIFEMFGITRDKLLYGGDGKLTSDEIIAMLTCNNGYLIANRFSGDNYDIHIAKKQLFAVLQDMSDNYQYSGSDQEHLSDTFRTCLSYMEKYGKDWYKEWNTTYGSDGKQILDGRSREAREFKDFLDGLGNAQDILKYGSSAAEYLARLFADYQAGLQVIDSFERNYAGNETILKAAEQLSGLYNTEFRAWADEAFDIAKEYGLDYALKAVSDSCPVVAVVNKIGEGIDLVGEMTGLGSASHSMYDSLTYHKLYSASYASYDKALVNLKSQIPDTEEYETASRDLENCFNLHKNNTVKMFDAMAGSTNGVQQSYYKYCAKQASLMSIKTGSVPSILTFEEFCSINS